jgi:hypothetical protein
MKKKEMHLMLGRAKARFEQMADVSDRAAEYRSFVEAIQAATDLLDQQNQEVKPGDIVQVNPHADLDPCWHGVPLVVEEVTVWGIVAFALSPNAGSHKDPPSRLYIRLGYTNNPARFVRVGIAPFIPRDVAGSVLGDVE